jgi:hypothetical protein
MFLDWIFFPGFRKVKLKKNVFITGVPRSATTYLLNILAEDKKNFTCFKLWEIIFAPSIIQKYIFLGLIWIDRKIGRPLYRISLLSDRIFIGKISKIHETGLAKPEEDELLLLYAFGSMFFTFFFPEVKALDAHFFFDEDLPQRKREKLMLFYKRCVQRHVFVFDRKEEKQFLSKNPCFISKTVSLSKTFPDAKLIYMLRSPFKTIPSTISLNANLYSIFGWKKKENPIAIETRDLIIRWYKMADASIKNNWEGRNVIVPFKRITQQPRNTVNEIYDFLKIIPGEEIEKLLVKEDERVSKYKSAHQYKKPEGMNDEEISKELDFIVNGIYKDEI